ncbi:hypothetical protein [Vibrio mexicanus]|uniref:hypothetical protein n=1 Tax=Vibrio mexicanus TaxID=1004326 RepID=UPI00063C9CEB|nr:hypothetical protein [Vibrio mexicanus]
MIKVPWISCFIDNISSTKLSGWVVDKNYPNLDLSIEVEINGQRFPLPLNVARKDLSDKGYKLYSGFDIDISSLDLQCQSWLASIYISGNNIRVMENIYIK